MHNQELLAHYNLQQMTLPWQLIFTHVHCSYEMDPLIDTCEYVPTNDTNFILSLSIFYFGV